MKKHKKIACNKLLNLFVLLGIFFIFGGYAMFSEKNIGFGVLFIILALLFIIVSVIFMPYLYIFDDNGIAMRYLFFPSEIYLWENIRSIIVSFDHSSIKHYSIFNLFFSYYFYLDGKVEGKKRFYMRGEIRKSHRTKRLIKSYWKKDIDN